MKNRAFGAIAVVLGGASALTWSLPAGAQEWLKDRKISEGPGYQAGDFEVHPGLAAEIGWDSNYLGRSDKTGPSDPGAPHYLLNGAPAFGPIDSAELRITPSLSIRTSPSSQRAEGSPAPTERPPVSFGFGATGTYREFFNPALQNERNMSAAATASLGILPGREWSGSINAAYTRLIQPTIVGDPDFSYNNDIVSVNADLHTQPNMGTLDWHFGYTYTGTFFEQSSGTPYNNSFHTGYTRGRWRFRPRTALLYDGQISFRTFSDTSNAAFELHQSTPVRARIGLEGLVTPRFSLLGMVGYGATLSNPLSPTDTSLRNYDSIIGTLELRFYPGGQPGTQPAGPDAKPSLLVSTIALGYNRDFQASFLDDFYGIDRGYLKVDYFFAGRFLVTLQGASGRTSIPICSLGRGMAATRRSPSRWRAPTRTSVRMRLCSSSTVSSPRSGSTRRALTSRTSATRFSRRSRPGNLGAIKATI